MDTRDCFNRHPRPCIRCRHYRSSYNECEVRRPENTKEDPVYERVTTTGSAQGMRSDEGLCGYDGVWFDEDAGFCDRLKRAFG